MGLGFSLYLCTCGRVTQVPAGLTQATGLGLGRAPALTNAQAQGPGLGGFPGLVPVVLPCGELSALLLKDSQSDRRHESLLESLRGAGDQRWEPR